MEMNASLPRWFIRLRRIVNALTTGLNVLGTLLIVAIMVLVNSDVIGRSLFDAPVSGVPEMVSMSIVAIVFLQIAQTFAKGRLTRTEALPGYILKRAPRLHALLEVAFALAAFGLIWVMLRASGPLFMKSWVRGTFEGTIGDFTAPVWPVKLIILIGSTALLVQIGMFALAAVFTLIGGRK